MKTITKTFYVDTDDFKDLKLITGWSIYVQAEKSDVRPHEIQISWTEPEKKIETTIEEIVHLYLAYKQSFPFQEESLREFLERNLGANKWKLKQ